MYVQGKIKRCDFTQRDYDDQVDGVHVVAQGASGRWCCVMHMGLPEAQRQGIDVLTYEDAVAKVKARDDGGWVEF